jgi:uncharacterized protein
MNRPRALSPSIPWPARALAAAGHYWTVAPTALHSLPLRSRPSAPASARPWSTWADDPKLGQVRISGALQEAPSGEERTLVVFVHGLGGDTGSYYLLAAARAASVAGFASLRLSLRGADRSGEAIYHAGLTADVHTALASPELARYTRVYLFGYSLGGHIVLRAATELLDPRVRAVAAVCPPLDLLASCQAMDEPLRLPYRHYVLNALKEHYAAVAARREVPISVAEARRIRKFREWDERIVAPWFGFASARYYYEEASVAPRLPRVARPALVVAARHDPMVPESTVRPALERHRAPVDVRWVEHGGHVGFPASVDLGVAGSSGLEAQVLAWLARHE